MTESTTTSHFWIAGPPFFSSTVLVASGSRGESSEAVSVACELFDLDGTPVERFAIEFPEREVGIIEVEPFMSSLKMQSGIVQGHLVVTSRIGTRHLCRYQTGGQHADVMSSPRTLHSREMAFIPLLLGGRREHLLVVVNTGTDDAQVIVRVLYGTRAPEWTVQVPANGCRVVSLEHELLARFDDASWQKGVLQGYVRISPRSQSPVVCQMIGRLPGETEEQETYRVVSAW